MSTILQIFLFVTLLATQSACQGSQGLEQIDYFYTYQDFRRQFPRNLTEQEIPARQRIFKKNYDDLIALRKEGRDVVVTKFLDWTQAQKNDYFNYRPELLNIPASTRPLTSGLLFASPPSFDWRTLGRVTSVKDQGSCGSCWAFCATAQYQSMLAIATNGTIYDLAEQYALECENTYSLGCRGGYPSEALKLFDRTGIPLQTAYPYNFGTSYPSICNTTTGRVKLTQTGNNVTFYYFQNLTIQQLQQDLVNYGPISVGVYASDPGFYAAGPSGAISCAPTSLINHAVLLVGYNATHWYVKNSWGSATFGSSGYGYITKNTSNDCNLRQYVSQMQVNFGFQPTPPTPDPTVLNLTVTLTDSFGDGWNGNIISIRQNNTVVGTFGSAFTTGLSSGPFYFNVQGAAQVQIVTSTLGTKSNQIGFTIKAPNGTIIYQRVNGTVFDATTVFSTFCPIGLCPPVLLLAITMVDSFGDGWNGNVIGLFQNNALVGSFGSTFTTGTSSGPIFISINGAILTQILVSQFATKSNQIGFTVKAPNGTIIHQRTAGITYGYNVIFTTFCPVAACPSSTLLTVEMTDLYGDGWNGNILGIRENGTIVGTFGATFTSGFAGASTYITVQGNVGAQVVVVQLGSWTEEVAFSVFYPSGILVHQRLSGSPFNATTIFATFCPVAPCTNLITLSINLADSYGDGWNSNVLAVKQNNCSLGTFGTNFTGGFVYGPILITVVGNADTQIVVHQIGSRKTSEIGFSVYAPNGTLLYQRTNGTSFTASTIFYSFCPLGGCPSTITLNITMTDSVGNGWNGDIIAIKQNDIIMGTFGGAFTTGFSSGPIYITVTGNIEAQIVPTQISSYTNQHGFLIKAPNGTVVYERVSGVSFSPSTIFSTFCPIGGCTNNQAVTYYLTMTDSYGDGWQGTELAFKQNGTIISTFTLPTGSNNGPLPYSFQRFLFVNITVYVLGSYTNEVGFQIRNAAGVLVVSRPSGTKFFGNSIVASFCPECVNLSPVTIVSDTEPAQQKVTVTENPTSETPTAQQSNQGYIIATYILVAVVVILATSLSISIYKLTKSSQSLSKSQKNPTEDINPSTKNLFSQAMETQHQI